MSRPRQTQGVLLAAAELRWKGYHHEEDAIGSRCGRDFGRFRSLARLWWSAL
jgi:hypothetical protein